MKIHKLRAYASAGIGAPAEPLFTEEEPTYDVLMNLCWAALLLVAMLFLAVVLIDRFVINKR